MYFTEHTKRNRNRNGTLFLKWFLGTMGQNIFSDQEKVFTFC